MISAYDIIDVALKSTDFYQFKHYCIELLTKDIEQDELDEDAYNDAMWST